MFQELVSLLSIEFEVAQSTVIRWFKGQTRPHPRIEKQIRERVMNFLNLSK